MPPFKLVSDFGMMGDQPQAVDALVRGAAVQPEVRYRDVNGEIHHEKPAPQPMTTRSPSQGLRRVSGVAPANSVGETNGGLGQAIAVSARFLENDEEPGQPAAVPSRSSLHSVRIYPYGVARNRLVQAAKRLSVPAVVVNDVSDADVLITLRSYYRNRMQSIMDAEQRGMPIYVLRANTVNQMEQSLAELFNLSFDSAGPSAGAEAWDEVSNQTQQAIQAVLNGQRWADLPPATSAIRRLQHDMARQAQLVSHSYGKEPHRRVRIFRE